MWKSLTFPVIFIVCLGLIHNSSVMITSAMDQSRPGPGQTCVDLPDTEDHIDRVECCSNAQVYEYDHDKGEYRWVTYCSMCEWNIHTLEPNCSNYKKFQTVQSESSNIENNAGIIVDGDPLEDNANKSSKIVPKTGTLGKNVDPLLDKNPDGVSENNPKSNNKSKLFKLSPDFPSKFGNPTSQESEAGIAGQDLPAATDKTLNPVIICTNPNNKIPCNGTNDSDNMKGTDGDDFIYGFQGDDRISGLGNYNGPIGYDYIDGGDGNDILYGGDDNDIIEGWAGNDKIYGEGSLDSLSGWEGDDVIDGGSGNDRIWGHYGKDTIYGGEGDDMIYHGDHEESTRVDIESDGSEDVIDCGPGQDHVWINILDNDRTMNCEKTHKNVEDVSSQSTEATDPRD